MAKRRPGIPKAVHDDVLNEYSHLCAVCGAARPQLHHIDEDPENNDPQNLIPLCPNCHLTDQHNPTRQIELGILQLFRRYKDPAILSPQFEVLYRRIKYIFVEEIPDDNEWAQNQQILFEFVRSLQMGDYFVAQLQRALMRPMTAGGYNRHDEADRARYRARAKLDKEQYIRNLPAMGDAVARIIMELLRFQNWHAERGEGHS